MNMCDVAGRVVDDAACGKSWGHKLLEWSVSMLVAMRRACELMEYPKDAFACALLPPGRTGRGG